MKQEIQVLFNKKVVKYIDLHYGEKMCHVEHANDIRNFMEWAYSVGQNNAFQSILVEKPLNKGKCNGRLIELATEIHEQCQYGASISDIIGLLQRRP